MHFFDIDRSTGYPLSKPGSEISTNMRSDGVTVRQHLFTDANGEVIVLGTDYGVPPQYATGQPANVGGDPVASLRRQVAVSADHAELGRQYIDAGSGQVDPARWDDFLQAAQQAGLRMTVTSNGIQNPYYQGMDNARIIAGGYENSLTINVYNPTTGSTFLDAGIEAGASVMFNRTQSAQVAIRTQMGEALEYNGRIDTALAAADLSYVAPKTLFIGHSQGTINGNRAIERMTDEQKDRIQIFDLGRYYPHDTDKSIGLATIVNDRNDYARLESARLQFDPASSYASNDPRRRYIWTDFNNDGQGETGNNHSMYLYLQRREVRAALGMTRPQILTQPFTYAPR